MNIKFSPPDMSEAEIASIVGALKSGWITTGPKTKEFERQIADYCGTARAVCLNSATACLELTLKILGVKAGDEVITSSYTYTASASVIEHVGAKIVLVDTKAGSYEMDYDQLESAISSKTKAIIPVDIGGVPADYDTIYDIVYRKAKLFEASDNRLQKTLGRIVVLEDAAHSFGSNYKDQKIGNIADFTCFSFHAVKNLTTAEGGAVVWKNIDGIDDEWLYNEYMLWSLHGQNKDALSKTTLGSWEYDIERLGQKCNMTDIMAAIGMAQLKRYPQMLERRKHITECYTKLLQGVGIQILQHDTNTKRSNRHLFLTRVIGIDEKQRNNIIVKLAEKGIAVNVHYKPLPMHTAYQKLGFRIKDFPNSYKQYENEITLPLHTLLTEEEIRYIAENYKKILGHR